MKILGFGVSLGVVLFCLSGCFNNGVQQQDVKKTKNIHRSKSKNSVAQSVSFHHDGVLTILSSQNGNKISVEYERADTPEKRTQGLMYRTSMDELQGIFFVFDDTAPRYFYMRNTYMPLDILFLDNEKKVVKIYHDTQPGSEELLPSVTESHYVLEVCAGFCQRHGVVEGDLLEC